MRRYKIVITGENAKAPSVVYDSQTNGQDNPGALDIAFDVSVGPFNLAFASSYVEVFGIALPDVAKVRQWQNGTLSLYGGFSSGYPLAKASQYGLLASGSILQAFGNWTGTHQSIIFFLTPAGIDNPIVFFWKKGQKLSNAIIAAIQTGYPGFNTKSYLKTDPVATNDDLHYCQNLYSFGNYIKEMTKKLGLAHAQGGINLYSNGGGIAGIYDTSNTNTVAKLDFNDFQGQPVYFGVGGAATAQTTLNLRADLAYAGQFSFPTQVATGYLLNQPAASAPLAKDNSALTGTYTITQLRHVGRFRDPQGQSWITIADGVPLNG